MLTRLISACAILGAITHAAVGQEVRGVAYSADTKSPEPMVSVVLVSSRGTIVTGTLSGSDGRFVLKSPNNGSFTIRARKLGFAPDSSSLVLESGKTRQFNPTLRKLAYSLGSVSVEGQHRCTPGTASSGVATVWEAAQSALTATVATSYEGQIDFRLREFHQELDAGKGLVLRGTSRVLYARNAEPYHSVSPDSVSTIGFAQRDADSTTYFVPDARMLTSDAFTLTHCFQVIKDAGRPRDVGLAFEPTRSSQLVDVKGALWLDLQSATLKDLDYWYVFPGLRNRQSDLATAAGGHVEYRRLDEGAWIVGKWILRVPAQMERTAAIVPTSAGQSTLERGRSAGPIIVWEVGGEVQKVLRGAAAESHGTATVGSVHGTIVVPAEMGNVQTIVQLQPDDSTRAGARSATISEGTFAFDSVPEGTYTLAVHAALFDTLNIAVAPVSINVTPATQQVVSITIPSPREARLAVCKEMQPSAAVLHGYVRDSATGNPIPAARVEASWLTGIIRSGPGGGGLSATPHQVRTLTNGEGRFVFCGLAPTDRLLVSASSSGFRSRRSPSLTVVAGGMSFVTIEIPRH